MRIPVNILVKCDLSMSELALFLAEEYNITPKEVLVPSSNKKLWPDEEYFEFHENELHFMLHANENENDLGLNLEGYNFDLSIAALINDNELRNTKRVEFATKIFEVLRCGIKCNLLVLNNHQTVIASHNPLK